MEQFVKGDRLKSNIFLKLELIADAVFQAAAGQLFLFINLSRSLFI